MKLSGYNATCNFPPHVLKGVPVAYTTCLHFISLFSKNSLLRGQDSNLRPLGYGPNELPLLHPAMFDFDANIRQNF